MTTQDPTIKTNPVADAREVMQPARAPSETTRAVKRNSAIVNAEVAGRPSPAIIQSPPGNTEEEFQEYMSAGCTAVVPPGARKIYLIMVTITMLVGALIVYGLFRLLDL